MRNLLLTTAFIVISAGAGAMAAPYEGKWVSHQTHCAVAPGDTASDGSVPDGTITIKGKSLEEWEGSCKIRSAKQKGETWNLALRCTSEGEAMNSTLSMKIDGDVAIIKGRGTRLRCPR